MDLADSIKRLREVLRERYKMTNPTTQDILNVEFNSAVYFPESIQTINQLVELVAEMRDRVDFLSDLINCNDPDYIVVEETLTKADALLTKLGEA